ncbi:hypothetical protein LOK49_LG15G01594 [Camellia lanceoleosa]|uniref:Uncharacterized protein n=1 Tax=Camellia lanceoleosa TaxID=1840588 RepID=A0ACC0F2W9_9ERIC|nr:hypothetical protein LOK49_LG15G01594 [Camellia lanceoleosa]
MGRITRGEPKGGRKSPRISTHLKFEVTRHCLPDIPDISSLSDLSLQPSVNILGAKPRRSPCRAVVLKAYLSYGASELGLGLEGHMSFVSVIYVADAYMFCVLSMDF